MLLFASRDFTVVTSPLFGFVMDRVEAFWLSRRFVGSGFFFFVFFSSDLVRGTREADFLFSGFYAGGSAILEAGFLGPLKGGS